MTCLKEFYQMWLCTKITRVSILLISLITSFNMTTVTSNTCFCPGPHSLKHISNHDWLSSQCLHLSYDSFTLIIYVSRWCLKQSLGGVLNTLLLRYHQRKKNHTGLSQGALVATLGHHSTQLPCGSRVSSVFLQQLCVDD